MSDYTYQDNMHIIDDILNELMIERTTAETIGYDLAFQMVMLKMFPSVSEQGEIIEKLFKTYADEHTVKEWYESLFHVEIKKR